ncbi:hypothetical protein [Paenibacillus sp. N3.4]|uniref:hypothetical protein n=1 Tax=Paenibacillus sp. N3.4 TaxID=2603222 RepID=UPI0021C43D98|nr:hypothetical protein [Paenibacillus sp. N3.4]
MLLVLLVVGGTSLFGGQPPVSAANSTSTLPSSKSEGAADLNDAAGLSAFIDGIMKGQMDNFKIPGGVITIVKDGKTLLAKGYGHSNIEMVRQSTQRPVYFGSLRQRSCLLGRP